MRCVDRSAWAPVRALVLLGFEHIEYTIKQPIIHRIRRDQDEAFKAEYELRRIEPAVRYVAVRKLLVESGFKKSGDTTSQCQ